MKERKKFNCGFHNMTKMKSCDAQCTTCKSDQKIIDLKNKIKELGNEKIQSQD